MKLTNAIALLSMALIGALPLAAQQAQPQVTLTAIGQLKNAKKLSQVRLLPPPAIEKGVISVMNPNPDEAPLALRTKDFRFFIVMTPPELAAASRAYANGDLKSARRQFADVRSKYGAFIGIPNNPALQAARMELDCDVRLMDWAAVGKLATDNPGKAFMEAEDRVVLDAARLLSQVSDDPGTADARSKSIEEYLSGAKAKTINSEVYGWMKYALARAIASGIPAAELQGGISEANVERASLAVDAYCESVASNHGRNLELPVDALKRAFAILWAMPGVKSYALATKQMDAKRWDGAPQNFRDAATLAYMLENIFEPGQKDANIQKAASLHFNRMQGTKQSAAK